MSRMRSKMSKKNNWYIDPERYLELKHFCLQYPEWRRKLNFLMPMATSSYANQKPRKGRATSDVVGSFMEQSFEIITMVDMVENSCMEADHAIWRWLLVGVTENVGYEELKARGIPCGKDYYYDAYHKFFYILDKERK